MNKISYDFWKELAEPPLRQKCPKLDFLKNNTRTIVYHFLSTLRSSPFFLRHLVYPNFHIRDRNEHLWMGKLLPGRSVAGEGRYPVAYDKRGRDLYCFLSVQNEGNVESSRNGACYKTRTRSRRIGKRWSGAMESWRRERGGWMEAKREKESHIQSRAKRMSFVGVQLHRCCIHVPFE